MVNQQRKPRGAGKLPSSLRCRFAEGENALPDPVLLVQAFAASASTAAFVVWLLAWPWNAPHRWRSTLGYLLGMASAMAVACRLLMVRPHWPPRVDQDRFLFVLLPSLFCVEMTAAFHMRPLLIWSLRLLLAGGVAPILLYGSVYVSDSAGPGTRRWTPYQAVLVFFMLGLALSTVWRLLSKLQRQTQSQVVPLAVALSCLGAAATVALSGYASIAGVGVALAAAVTGCALAARISRNSPDLDTAVSLSVVGLFALVVVGRYFGNLDLGHAVALLFAPLLSWLPEWSPLNRLGSTGRGVSRLVLTTVPIAVVLALAYQQFVRDSTRFAPTSSSEPSLQDYLDFGK